MRARSCRHVVTAMIDGLNSYFANAMGKALAWAVIAGMVLMAVLIWLVPWLWSVIKPWLHMITA